jgi:hydroxymethylglutaryl-CoA lyase
MNFRTKIHVPKIRTNFRERVAMNGRVEIFEVGPRDGLQNEARRSPRPTRWRWSTCCPARGSAHRGGEFRQPQMGAADGRQCRGSGRHHARAGVRYAALTPNMKGYEGARAARADEVAIFGSASEGFSRPISTPRSRKPRALRPGGGGREEPTACRCAAMSPAWSSVPMTGRRARRGRARGRRGFSAMGCYEISLGDTIGRGTPEAVDGDAGRGAGRGSGGAPRGAFPRHVRPRARQYRGGAGAGPAGLRRCRGRPRRLPLCAGGGGQCRDGGRGMRGWRRWATTRGSTRR